MSNLHRQNNQGNGPISNWDNIIISNKMGKTYNTMNSNSKRFYRIVLVVMGLAILVIGINGILK